MGKARGWVFAVSLFFGRGAGCRGDAVAYSFSLSISLESHDLCPSVFPIKKDLPLWGCFPKIPLHLSLFIYSTSCLSILLFPVFCFCFSFDSCSACNRRVLWVPSIQKMAYPWPTPPPFPPNSSLATCACMCTSAWVNGVCGYVCMICHKEGSWASLSEHCCLGPNVLGLLSM